MVVMAVLPPSLGCREVFTGRETLRLHCRPTTVADSRAAATASAVALAAARRLRLVRARRRPWCRRPRRQESGMCVGECEGLRLESARDCVGERWYSVKLAAMTL